MSSRCPIMMNLLPRVRRCGDVANVLVTACRSALEMHSMLAAQGRLDTDAMSSTGRNRRIWGPFRIEHFHTHFCPKICRLGCPSMYQHCGRRLAQQPKLSLQHHLCTRLIIINIYKCFIDACHDVGHWPWHGVNLTRSISRRVLSPATLHLTAKLLLGTRQGKFANLPSQLRREKLAMPCISHSQASSPVTIKHHQSVMQSMQASVQSAIHLPTGRP